MKTIKNVLLLDLVAEGIQMTEPVGMGSITAVLRLNQYNTTLLACYLSQINYESIISHNPDLIAFSIHPNTFEPIKEILQKIRALLPNCILIAGGYYATYNADYVIKNSEIQYIVYGEGEITTLKLLDCLNEQGDLSQVNGIFYTSNQEVVKTPPREFIENLDVLPFPSRDIMVDHHLIYAPIEGSRGCSNTCRFCSLQKFWTNEKMKLRFKSVKRTIDEMEYIHKNYHINSFLFLDCSFENPYLNQSRIVDTANEIISRNLNVAYFINTRASFHKIATDELMDLLLRSGLCGIFIGIESFNEDDLKLFGKSSNHQDSLAALDKLSIYPIIIDIGLINFHPYSTIEKIESNVKYIQKYKLGSRIYMFFKKLLPYKGTPIHDKIIEDGFSIEDGSYILNYRFSDPQVDILYNFLSNFIDDLNCRNNVVLRLDYIFNNNNYYFLYYTNQYKTIIKDLDEPNNQKTIDAIEHYNQLLEELKETFNYKNCVWLLRLCNLFRDAWNEEAANEICNEYIDYDFMMDSLNKLERAKFKLLKRLEITRNTNA